MKQFLLWQLSLQHAFKKKNQNFDVCVAILIWKMEEKLSSYYALLFQERWKQSWSRKRFVQCLEKMLWLIKCLRSGLQSFVLEIFCWRMLLCSQIDQLKLIAQSNQDINWEQSTSYHVGKSQHTQNIHIKRWKSFAPAWLH